MDPLGSSILHLAAFSPFILVLFITFRVLKVIK
jgi:hypothetical protein